MSNINWYKIEDLYTVEKYKIKHNRKPKTKWIKLPCVYKIKIADKVDTPVPPMPAIKILAMPVGNSGSGKLM